MLSGKDEFKLFQHYMYFSSDSCSRAIVRSSDSSSLFCFCLFVFPLILLLFFYSLLKLLCFLSTVLFKQTIYEAGPSFSKLTMLLVNVS